MWRNFYAVLAVLLVTMTALPSMAGQETFRRFTDDELLRIMRSEGYDSVSLEKSGMIHIEHKGISYVLLNGDDGDLQLYYGVRGFDISYMDINEWNRTHRLSRAYLDSDRDPVLETDLLSNGGMTIRNVTETVKIFLQSVDAYKTFLREHNRS
jgi:hypothetical protein